MTDENNQLVTIEQLDNTIDRYETEIKDLEEVRRSVLVRIAQYEDRTTRVNFAKKDPKKRGRDFERLERAKAEDRRLVHTLHELRTQVDAHRVDRQTRN